MDNILDDTLRQQQEVPPLTDREIFTRIWASPRTVFRFIHEQQYDRHVTLLLALSGIAKAFDRATSNNMGDKFPLIGIIILCITLGALLGYLGTYIYSGLIRWTGTWLGGEGNTGSILRVLAYASIPTIVAMVFLIPQIAIYGSEIFKKNAELTSSDFGNNLLFYLSAVLELALGVWTFILGMVGLSVVQGYSIWKGLLNMILPVVVILVPILLFVYIMRI